ncbi:jhy protein homolog isoform X1 [Oenanthe melanoleuca]|uniref:jhy protein homolog isoform X1 n=1 Tax=Oenanthe melanoleuca TaxID=2939378 RepID=UPI0024C0ED55|nr:jhy protein homolog isoform X1 [Oenanthe melanoleuca]XP_056365773.1 jhy protein homolog isoform X1 [Oenanthe melanoleuca]XP_056365774.1 jhy protein homolog isoform X1 [Oenanthe melanoleuca]
MNSSNMKYLSVSSPHTYSMNNIHVPPKVLVPPVFQPASWERERSSASSLEDSQESVSESLEKERHFQQRLQHRILENQEIVGQGPGDTLEDDSLEEDSLEEMSFEEKGAEYDTNKKGKPKVDASGRKKLPVDKYSSLMYNPHWKSAKKGAGFFKAEKAPKISGGSSGDFSEDSFYLHSDDSSENNQQEAKTQDSLPEFGPELFSSHGADVASNEPVGPQAKRKEPADGFHSKNNPGRAFPPQHQQDPPQRAKKNFIKKNKLTLGLQSVKNSYLELHNRKQVLQGQLTDLTPVDEEPLQSVPASQTGKMKPEDKWYPKGQQLKEQHKFFQRNKTESNQTFSARVFPRKDGQEPPGRAAEAKPWLRNQQQIPGFQAAPSPSSALQEYLNPSSSLGPDPAEKPQSGSNNFPNSALTRPTYHYLPIFQNFYPPEVLNPEDPSKENKKYQHEFPTRIPHQQQHFSKNDSSSGQAHPELGNISSDFNAIFQEKVKEQAPIQDFKNHIHEDNSSPTAACRTSHVKEKMEQHQPRISDFGDDFADMWFWGFLPPALPQAQRDSQGISGGAEGNPRKMRRISSEGSLLQNGKQKQPKASKKVCGSKFYINLNMKLGGLGPDYETIKEKKEKLKLQKEYSRQINEYNMKNITVVQRLPAKPQVSSVSRQKALEYAKRIPRPKTFITRPSDQEVKEAVPQPGTSLPQIPSLESLWDRHEREKELVAAFKSLHIF